MYAEGLEWERPWEAHGPAGGAMGGAPPAARNGDPDDLSDLGVTVVDTTFGAARR